MPIYRPSIALAAPNSETDALLLCQYYGPGASGLQVDSLTAPMAIQLEANGMAMMPQGAQRDEPATIGPLAQTAREQRDRQHEWLTMLTRTEKLVERVTQRTVLLQALRSPFALLTDVNLLVPEPGTLARIARAFENDHFNLYRPRFLAHPLRIVAVSANAYADNAVTVHLYPDAMWIRKHVHDGSEVVQRRIRSLLRGVDVWLPSPADDLYLVATYAFMRGRTTLAELDHGSRLIHENGVEWTLLMEEARAFGGQDALYAYLRLIQITDRCVGLRSMDVEQALTELQASRATHAIRIWLDRVGDRIELPVQFPLVPRTVHSALHHVPAVWNRVGPRETALDLAAHGYAIASHLVQRD